MAVHLLTGDDESILRAAVSDLVHELVGDGDRSLMVDEFDGDESRCGASSTPPRPRRSSPSGASSWRATSAGSPPTSSRRSSPTSPIRCRRTELVLVGGGGRLAKALTDAVKAAGGDRALDTTPPPRARDRQAWIDDAGRRRRACGCRRRRPTAIAERLGEDVGRLDGLLATLAGDVRRAAGRSAPTTSSRSSARPAACRRGSSPTPSTPATPRPRSALLARMTGAGGRHPLQVMAILHGHYGRLARLDGVEAPSEAEAAEVLGIKPGFPARKALTQYRRLGGGGVRRAIDLLAAADLDLRGASDLARRRRDGGPRRPAVALAAEHRACAAESSRRRRRRSAARRSTDRQAEAVTFFIRRLLRRAAWLGWMTPLAAAMSRRLTARRTSSSLASVPIERGRPS